MQVKATFYMNCAGSEGQFAATTTLDVTEDEYQLMIDSTSTAMRGQGSYQMIGPNGVHLINMRYVTNYTIEKVQ